MHDPISHTITLNRSEIATYRLTLAAIVSFIISTAAPVNSLSFQKADSLIQRDSTLETMFSNAVSLFNEHDDTGESLEEAKHEFSVILTTHAHHAPSIAYLGLIALEQERIQNADSLFHRALVEDSTCAEARVGISQIFRHDAKWNAGYDALRLAIMLAPSSVLARWELATDLLHGAETPLNDDRVREAIPHLEYIVDRDSNARDAHLDLAQSYERLGQLQEAVRHFRAVVRIGQLPDDGDVWVYTVHQDLARCLEKLGAYTDAVQELKLYRANLVEFGASDKTVNDVDRQIEELEQK